MEGYKQVFTWDTDDVISWIKGLDKSLEQHVAQFSAHCICGHDLLKLSLQQLEYLKVTQVGHQELMLEAVEQLSILEGSHAKSSAVSFASVLSKKTSQLINAISSPKHKTVPDTSGFLTRMEMTAGVMTTAKSLINWLERNPCSFITDYKSFRQDILRSTLDLSSILENDFDPNVMVESCRKILKLTSSMMSPENFAIVEPVNLVSVTLSPREDTGLGFSIERSKQGNLLVSTVSQGSPAHECGVFQFGVEVVQINSQNVIGWEVSNVVDTLKQSGHEVTLILKVPNPQLVKEEERDYQTDEGVVADGGSGLCDPLDPPSNQIADTLIESDGVSIDDLDEEDGEGFKSPDGFDGDTDLSGLHNILRNKKVSDLDIKRTSSAPITAWDKLSNILDTKASEDPAGNTVDNTIDNTIDNIDGSSKLPNLAMNFEQRLHQRTASEGQGIVRDRPTDTLPHVAYRTQIIGGVVVRIPIKKDEDADKVHSKKVKLKGVSGYGKSKSPAVGKKVKKNSTSSTSDVSVTSEPSDASPEKGRAVFYDAKEITIAGQTTKQVTVSAVSEPKEDGVTVAVKKVSNPALLVPCFQLKNAEHEGWMSKLGGSGFTPKNWRRRWFVLKDKKLYYYKTSFDITALGIVDLTGYIVVSAPELKKKHGLKAERVGARTYIFVADSEDEMTRWLEVLNKAAVVDSEHAIPLTASIEASDDEL